MGTTASSYVVNDRIEEARLQDNMQKQLHAEFNLIDVNRDGTVTRDELHQFFILEKVGTMEASPLNERDSTHFYVSSTLFSLPLSKSFYQVSFRFWCIAVNH